MVYEFIVVGSGPAGATVAGRLARTKRAPKVLLIEAGGPNLNMDLRLLAERYTTMMQADVNWGYRSVPQEELKGRQIDFSRGKGLGGSSVINSAAWTVGPKDDCDRWAKMVGDESFSWKNARRMYNQLENYKPVNEMYAKNIKYAPGEHGQSGPVPIENPEAWERGFSEEMEAAMNFGMEVNLDISSGDPVGLSVVPVTGFKGVRWTSNFAFVQSAPQNLTVIANAPASKVIFAGNQAVGVETRAEKYLASKEVIISAGSLDSPKILHLSGIGPEKELAVRGIKCIQDIPGVGKNLQDLPMVQIIAEAPKGYSEAEIFGNPEDAAAAKVQFQKDGSDPYSTLSQCMGMGFLKADQELQSSPEFKALPKYFVGIFAMLMAQQSRGLVTLASDDPPGPPICDPKLYSHPFDRVNHIHALRHIVDLLHREPLASKITRLVQVPNSNSDEDLWEYLQEYVQLLPST